VEEEEFKVLILGKVVDRVVADVVTQAHLGRGPWLVVRVFLEKARLEAGATVTTKLVTILAQAAAANQPQAELRFLQATLERVEEMGLHQA
jgi:hypothetical protein